MAVVLAIAVLLAGAGMTTSVSASPGVFTYPDVHFPDGSWNRDFNDGVNQESIGRLGYLYERCSTDLTLGLNINAALVDPATTTSFGITLWVLDPTSGPDPGPEPQQFDYGTIGEYQDAYAAWVIAATAFHPYLYTYSDSSPVVASNGAAHTEHTFTIPAEALTFGAELQISVNGTINPPSGGYGFNGQISADEIAYLTCANGPEATAPEITVVKYIDGADANAAPGVQVAFGSTMNVTFEVTNSGDMRLDPVVLSDDTIASADISCPETALDPQQSMTCTATSPAPAPGVQHTNIATVTGTPVPLADDTQLGDVTDTDPANAFVAAGDVSITKTVAGPEPVPGQAYEFSLACTYESTAITLAAGDATFTLTDGATRTVTGLPQAAICTATELEAGGANSTTGSINGGAAATGVSFSGSVGESTAAFTFVNTFDLPATTTTPPAATTAPDGVASPVPPATTPASLPVTGRNTSGLLLCASALLALGSVLVVARRRCDDARPR